MKKISLVLLGLFALSMTIWAIVGNLQASNIFFIIGASFGIASIISAIDFRPILYSILRKDMIKRYRGKGLDSQIINQIMDAFELRKFDANERQDIEGMKLIIKELKQERQKLEYYNNTLENLIIQKEQEIDKLKNPPPPAKFKVGQRAGNFVIRTVTEDNSYTCFDANGKVQGLFREKDIELLMKLNPKDK